MDVFQGNRHVSKCVFSSCTTTRLSGIQEPIKTPLMKSLVKKDGRPTEVGLKAVEMFLDILPTYAHASSVSLVCLLSILCLTLASVSILPATYNRIHFLTHPTYSSILWRLPNKEGRRRHRTDRRPIFVAHQICKYNNRVIHIQTFVD